MIQLKRIFHTTALAAFAAVLVGLLSGEARAEPGSSWTLESQSGQVSLVKTGIAPVSLSAGDVFADGDWIETGPDGRALLRRGEERIVVAPNSRIGLPENNNGPYATRILHTLGTILLTVQKKAAQHFEIETPYLTAVVKGTTFTVGIQDGRAVVHVVEGLVEVKSLATGRSNLVRPGQTGSVIRGGGDVEIGGGDTRSTSASAAAVQGQGAGQVTAPVASLASPVAVAAVPKGKSQKIKIAKSHKVRIAKAFGLTDLDLTQSTKGLIRAASNDRKAASPGSKSSKNGEDDSDKKIRGKRAAIASGGLYSGGTATALSSNVSLSTSSTRLSSSSSAPTTEARFKTKSKSKSKNK